jgi:hypothetical protein
MATASERAIISAQVPSSLRDELAQLARLHDLSLSDEIRRAVRLHLRVEAVEAPGVSSSFRPESPASATGPVKAGAVEPLLRAGSEEDAA